MADLGQSPTSRLSVRRLHHNQRTVTLVLSGRVERVDVITLPEQVRGWLDECGADEVVCDVGAVTDSDAVTVDALARLQLTVRRFGGELRLCRVSRELHDVLLLTGLSGLMHEPRSD